MPATKKSTTTKRRTTTKTASKRSTTARSSSSRARASTSRARSTSTRGKSSGSMDALTMLKQDHRTVEKMFSQFQKAKAASEQGDLCQQICRELTIHAQIEEKSFYPEVKAKLKDMVLESLEEHKQVKTLIGELQSMKPGDELMKAKMKVLKDNVKHHVEEEEKQMFPKLTRGLGKERLMDIGERLRQDKMSMMGQIGRGEAMPMPRRVMEEVRDTVRR